MEHPEKSDGALHLYLRRNAVTEITDSSASFLGMLRATGTITHVDH
jgi:hypothetical protein